MAIKWFAQACECDGYRWAKTRHIGTPSSPHLILLLIILHIYEAGPLCCSLQLSFKTCTVMLSSSIKNEIRSIIPFLGALLCKSQVAWQRVGLGTGKGQRRAALHSRRCAGAPQRDTCHAGTRGARLLRRRATVVLPRARE